MKIHALALHETGLTSGEQAIQWEDVVAISSGGQSSRSGEASALHITVKGRDGTTLHHEERTLSNYLGFRTYKGLPNKRVSEVHSLYDEIVRRVEPRLWNEFLQALTSGARISFGDSAVSCEGVWGPSGLLGKKSKLVVPMELLREFLVGGWFKGDGAGLIWMSPQSPREKPWALSHNFLGAPNAFILERYFAPIIQANRQKLVHELLQGGYKVTFALLSIDANGIEYKRPWPLRARRIPWSAYLGYQVGVVNSLEWSDKLRILYRDETGNMQEAEVGKVEEIRDPAAAYAYLNGFNSAIQAGLMQR